MFYAARFYNGKASSVTQICKELGKLYPWLCLSSLLLDGLSLHLCSDHWLLPQVLLLVGILLLLAVVHRERKTKKQKSLFLVKLRSGKRPLSILNTPILAQRTVLSSC